jgi:hypothetical protein
MLAMIPRAGELARKGKPAMLRLVARWFRMPPPTKQSDFEAKFRSLCDDNPELAQSYMNALIRRPK